MTWKKKVSTKSVNLAVQRMSYFVWRDDMLHNVGRDPRPLLGAVWIAEGVSATWVKFVKSFKKKGNR